MTTRLEEAFPIVTIEGDNCYRRFVCHEIGLRQYEGELCVSFVGPGVDRMYRGRVVRNMPTIRDFREMDMASLQALTGFSYSVCAAVIQVINHFDGRFENTDLLPEKKSL